MSNPMLEMLNGTGNSNPRKQQIKEIVTMLKGMDNNQISTLQNIALNNPNFQQVMQFIRAAGSSQQAFIQLAQKNGFTLDEIKDLMR